MILNQTIKHFAIALLAILFCQDILAQENNELNIFELMRRKDISLSEKRNIAHKHFEKVGTGRGTGYKHFQRWYYEQRFHVDEKGFEISREKEFMAYKAAERFLKPQNQDRAVANWTELGPKTWNATTGWNPGVGRITSIAVQTSSINVIYVSSPGGGIWKTTNGGSTWSCLSDNFNAEWMHIYNLCIDPSNPNTIYAGVMGIDGGVIKSTNGGATWFATGAGGKDIRKIIVHPSNSNIVLVAASDGLWRSTNGGSSWTQTANTFSMSSPEDIEFKPGTPNTVYASGNASIIKRSTDNGVTWTDISLGSSGRTMLAVTPHKNSIVYAVQDNNDRFGKFYKSSNSGASFTTLITGNPANGTNFFGYSTSGSDNKGQAWHDMAICVNPTDSNEVHIGGVLLWKSTDGGNSFVAETDWQLPNTLGYTHPDMHALEYVGSTIYAGSDGGIYKSFNKGNTWTDFSTGLGIRQFYNISCAKTDDNIIYGAAQDNGVSIHQANGSWIDWLGADGVGSCISPTNANVGFGLSQNGKVLSSTLDGGQTRIILDDNHRGEWVVPLVIHPYSPDTLYVGWNGLFRVNANTGAVIDSFFTNIPYVGIDDGMDVIAVAPSNTRYMYVFNKETLILYRTSDGGANWTTLNVGVEITSICVSPSNPLKIWITTSASSNNVRVSTNGGNSWSIISTGLPSIAARSIVVDHTPNEALYLGMNIGVYYRDNANPNWVLHANGLPNVVINEVELQNSTRKVRIATYGRGVWETDMQPGVFAGEDIRLDCNKPSAILKAVGGVSYVWSNGATFSTTIVAPTVTTTYSVTATLANGSTAVDNVKVTVDKAAPTVSAGTDKTVNCLFSSALLTATGTGTFLWSNNATTASISVSPTITTTYTVTLTGLNGCTASDAVVVTANKTPPTLNPLSDATITCSVNAITLNAITNANTFLWNTGATTASITVNPTAKTTYRVTVTGSNACTNTDASTISIDKSPPIADAGNDLTLTCSNPSATLSAWGTLTSNYDYLWNTGATTQNISISPSTTRTYSLTVTGQNGCTATDVVLVTVNKTAPTINAGTDKTVNCTNPSATLIATSSANFLWNTGATTSSITVSPTVTTTYTITATSSNGCTASDAVIVTTDKTPPTANAGADVTVNCFSPSVYITASGNGTYLWTTGETINSIKVTPSSTTTYVVTVTGSNGCTASDAVIVTADKTPPTANAGADKTINCTILNATLVATGNGTFKWNTNATTASITVSPTFTSTYTVTVTAANGCKASDAVVVTVDKLPPTANAGADVTVTCISPSIYITATGGGSYLWNTGQTDNSIKVTPSLTTIYTVTVTATNGCTASDDVVVTAQSCLLPKFNAKVFLNHVNPNTQLMDSYLSTLGNFPSTDPYSAAPLSLYFYHVTPGSPAILNPTLLTATGANALIDWLFLELRTLPAGGSTTVPVATKSVLLKANGSLVNPDGTTPIDFPNLSTGNYYIVVRHRNHLGFRTLNPITLNAITPTLNFTNNSIPLYGTTPLFALNASISAMQGGDANFDGSIDAFDTINWESQNGLFDDYHNHADYNLDGSVDAFDSIVWEMNNGKFQEFD